MQIHKPISMNADVDQSFNEIELFRKEDFTNNKWKIVWM